MVLNVLDVQILKGTGPLIGHVAWLSSADGEGHLSEHYEVWQSWVPREQDHFLCAFTDVHSKRQSGYLTTSRLR